MENIKQVNIKNGTYNFFNDMINIKDFNSSLPKILVLTTLGTLQSKKIDDYENIYSANPLYLMIGEVIGHIKENNGNKYLVFDSFDEN